MKYGIGIFVLALGLAACSSEPKEKKKNQEEPPVLPSPYDSTNSRDPRPDSTAYVHHMTKTPSNQL